jgi:hypothetical protein
MIELLQRLYRIQVHINDMNFDQLSLQRCPVDNQYNQPHLFDSGIFPWDMKYKNMELQYNSGLDQKNSFVHNTPDQLDTKKVGFHHKVHR